MRAPRIDAETPFATDPLHVVLVENLEDKPETGFQFVLPLQEHRRRAGNDDFADLLPQQQLAGDQSGFDRLAEADVVGDEEIDARQEQRLSQGSS